MQIGRSIGLHEAPVVYTLFRNEKTGALDGERLNVDFAANARSLGAHAIEASDISSLKAALIESRDQMKTTVIVVETDRDQSVQGYESWWDVPVAEVSTQETVNKAFNEYVKNKKNERYYGRKT